MTEDTLLAKALLKNVKPKNLCGVQKAKNEHPALAAQIDELVASSVPFSIQSQTFKEAGIEIIPSTVSRHHRQVCQCRS